MRRWLRENAFECLFVAWTLVDMLVGDFGGAALLILILAIDANT